MTPSRYPILPMMIAGAAAMVGFGLARMRPADSASNQGAKAHDMPASEVASSPPVVLPDADLSTPEHFDEYVERLRSEGFDEELAQWLAISKKVRDDLPDSFAIARKNGLERPWAAAVALVSPEDGFAALNSLRSLNLGSFGELDESGVFFDTLGRTNPEAGLRLMGRLNNADTYGTVPALFSGWAAIDPDAALAAASALPARNVRENALLGIFQQVGKSGMHAMMEWADSQGPEIARLAFRSQFELQSGSRNARALIELAMEYPDAADPWVLTNTASGLVGEGAEGWKFLTKFPPGPKRDGMLSWFASRWSETDPQAAWELVRSLPREDQKTFFRSFSARDVVKAAPAEMTALAWELEDEMPLTVSVQEMVSHWSTFDPQAAFAWCQGIPETRRQLNALASAARGWATIDPQGAVRAVNGLTPAVRAKLLPSVLSSWAGKDSQAALEFAAALLPMDRTFGTTAAFEGWASRDPGAAAEALNALPSAGMESAYDRVAYRLGDTDPERAGEWLKSIPDERMQERVAQAVLKIWAQKDSASASEYLTTLATGGFRDRAIRGFVSYSKALDPDAAAQWAASVGNPDTRRQSIREVVESWRATDRDAALEFVASLDPGPFREEMLQLANKPPEMGIR